MGTYRLRVPASRVGYVPEAQGGLPPVPHVLCVLGTRTSLGRSVRTAFPGYHPRWEASVQSVKGKSIKAMFRVSDEVKDLSLGSKVRPCAWLKMAAPAK